MSDASGNAADELRAARETIQRQKATIDRFLLEKYEPVAIVGIGLRFPGGNTTVAGFADFLRAGGSGIGPLPRDRWDVDAFTPEHDDELGKIHTVGGGYLDRIDEFDAQFFNISPKEADYVDPQQRMLLETAWQALEHANIDPATLRGGNGSVFVGASSIDYALELDSLDYEQLDGHLAAGITSFPLSGRLSYFLGLHGPSVSVDTACASSLTAMHLAVKALRHGETDIALCGGVNAIHHPRILVMFSHANMLARDARCKTFDESADGYVRAEGCGVVVLKRLSDAKRDGDTVLALVRGTAVGQDGESAGLTVPNGSAQEAVMREALANAVLTPEDITYVEAHGTGTPLGDPIEMGAISDVFADSHTSTNPIMVGSVKTNLGHMEPAAGIVGVVKTVLQLRERTVFPHLNLVRPSGRIPWESIPVTVPTEATPWSADTRRAVVNSFGFAGAIAAAVLEEAPPAIVAAEHGNADTAPGPAVFTLSARSKRALESQVAAYREFLDTGTCPDIGDLCYTSTVGRSHFGWRLAGVVRDRDSLAALLDRHRSASAKAGKGSRKVAFLFSGQGSQYPGMGRALYEQFPTFRRTLDQCAQLFAPLLDRPLVPMVLGTAPAKEELDQTRYTQAALFAFEYSLAQLWLSWGVRPNVMIGHSIGEVVAAAVAGVFDLADGVRLVAARGRLMQSVSAPGGMCAVSAGVEHVEPVVEPYPDLAVAAVNSPGQCVVSGADAALAEVAELLRGRGYKVKRLAVSHAFHSPLMAEVFDAFAEAIADIEFREPSLTLVSNVSGEVAKPRELRTPGYWVRHIGEPVAFQRGMTAVERRGRHTFVEIGPSSSLTTLAKQCVEADEHQWVTSSARSDEDATTIRRALARLYTAGAAIRWSAVHEGRRRRKVTLPGYAFDRKRYWLPHGEQDRKPGAAVPVTTTHPLLGVQDSRDDATTRQFVTTVDESLAVGETSGVRVLPMAAHLETLLALQNAVYGHTRRTILDFDLRQPIALPADQPTEMRTLLHSGPGEHPRVEIGTIAESGDLLTHIHARFGESPEDQETLCASGAELVDAFTRADAPVDEWDSAEVYAELAAAGITCDENARFIHRLSRYESGLIAATLHTAPALLAHHVTPALLEAVFHAVTAAAGGAEALVPDGLAHLRLLREPRGSELRALVGLNGQDRADVVLLADDGPVLEIEGLALRPLPDDSSSGRDFFHLPMWVRRSVPEGSRARAHRLVVVHRDGSAFPDPAGPDVAVSFADGVEHALRLVGEQQATDVAWFWRTGGADGPRAECERNYRDLLDLVDGLRAARFGRDQRLWLVTERGQWLPEDRPGDPVELAAATVLGFGHVLLNEQPNFRTTVLDLDGDRADALLSEVRADVADDFQIAYRGDRRYVRRILPADHLVDPAATTELVPGGRTTTPEVEEDPLTGDRIRVQLRALPLSHLGVGTGGESGGPLGVGSAGVVVAAGPDAAFTVGTAVVTTVPAPARTRITVPSASAFAKPGNLSFTEAAALVSAYVPAFHVLHHIAHVRAGDRVLVCGDTGAVGQAVAELATRAGAEVVREAAAAPVNDTQLVFCGGSPAAVEADLRALVDGGLFVDLGAGGETLAAEVRRLRPDVLHHRFDADALRTPVLPSEVRGLIAAGELPPVGAEVYSRYELDEALDALDRGPRGGRAVIRFDEPVDGTGPRIRPDRVYLISGGLGALGLVAAEKLVRCGARHVWLVGRNTEVSGAVAKRTARLAGKAEVTLCRCDIADEDDVAALTARVAASPVPLGGILHTAGTLADAPVSGQTWESMDAVFRTKVYGTAHLHDLAESAPELDFFVGYSSAAAVVGGVTQANYAAGNAYLDNLMRWRNANGRPGLSVNWGPWSVVGMSANLTDQVRKAWADQGIEFFTPAKGVRALLTLLATPFDEVLAGRCDWDLFAAAKPIGNAIYERLVTPGRQASTAVDLDALLVRPATERVRVIEELVRTKVAVALHFDHPDDIEPDTEFTKIGLDSLVAMELRNALESTLRLPLPPSTVFDHPSADRLAEFLHSQLTTPASN